MKVFLSDIVDSVHTYLKEVLHKYCLDWTEYLLHFGYLLLYNSCLFSCKNVRYWVLNLSFTDEEVKSKEVNPF